MLRGVISCLSESLDSVRPERWMFCSSLNSWSRELFFEVDVNGTHLSQWYLHATFSSFSALCRVHKSLRHRHLRHVHDLAGHPGDAHHSNKPTPPPKHVGRKGGRDQEEEI